MMKVLCNILKSISKFTRRVIQFRPRMIQPTAPGDENIPRNPEGLPLPTGRASYEPLPLLLVGICFSAAGVSLQALQIKELLRPSFYWFCMALQFSFAALMVSVYIRKFSKLVAIILEHAGVFFGAMAFILAMTMNLPFRLVLISVIVYIFSILIIIIANLYKFFANPEE